MTYITYLFKKIAWGGLGALVLLTLAVSGCASRGEGLTLDKDGLHVGTSLAKRDQIAEDKSNAELAQVRARTEIEQDAAAASLEQGAAMGTVTRPAILAVGMALAVGIAAVGLGFGAKQAEVALGHILEVRKARQFTIALDVSGSGCHASFQATGYNADQIAQIVQGAPILDAPRLAELQSRVGDRGVRLLQERGELETALERLPIETEVISDD